MSNSEYLDTTAAAELMGISRSTLEKWRVAGQHLPFIRAGRLIRYAKADIDTWMTARKVRSTSQRVRNPNGGE
jgi:excisionase family DNA binding protein